MLQYSCFYITGRLHADIYIYFFKLIPYRKLHESYNASFYIDLSPILHRVTDHAKIVNYKSIVWTLKAFFMYVDQRPVSANLN